MTAAVIFPGQGSQSVGMGFELAQEYPVARSLWKSVDNALGRGLTKIIAEGPKEMLDDTINSQPAIFAVNSMYWELLSQTGLRPEFVAGHSLGELSAYAAAGAYSFEVGLKIVQERARLMAEAALEHPGEMLVVLGLDAQKVSVVSARAGVEVANFNSARQTVVAGAARNVRAAQEQLAKEGAKRTVKLAVSGPFHTSLMAGAAAGFAEFLDPLEFEDLNPEIRVISSVTGRLVTDAREAKRLLVEQIRCPVLWVDCVEFLIEQGVNEFIEAGPGRVLGGLVKRISSAVSIDHAQQRLGAVETVDKL